MLSGQLNWLTDNIKAALLSPSYVGGSVALYGTSGSPPTLPNRYYTDIEAYILTGDAPIITLIDKFVSTPDSGTGLTIWGAACAGIVTFQNLTANQTVGYYVLFKDPDTNNVNGAPATGNKGSSPLIFLGDEGDVIGQRTNGSNFQLVPHPLGFFDL